MFLPLLPPTLMMMFTFSSHFHRYYQMKPQELTMTGSFDLLKFLTGNKNANRNTTTNLMSLGHIDGLS